jgi:hypothetical protein
MFLFQLAWALVSPRLQPRGWMTNSPHSQDTGPWTGKEMDDKQSSTLFRTMDG